MRSPRQLEWIMESSFRKDFRTSKSKYSLSFFPVRGKHSYVRLMKKKLSRQRTSICLRVYEETNFAQFLRGRGGTKKAYERRQFRKSFLGEKLRPPNPGKRVKPSNLPTGIFPKVGGREMSFQEAKNPAKSLLRPSREGGRNPSISRLQKDCK